MICLTCTRNEGKKANELSEEDMSKKVNELQIKIKKKRVEKSQQEKEVYLVGS